MRRTRILFLADRFAFLNTANDQVSTPFVIQNGQTFISHAMWRTLPIPRPIRFSSWRTRMASPSWSFRRRIREATRG
ncbi:phage tail tip fiber protein [Pandoraea pnomenusa]|uniref:phage tail tip fiber protein n=1 Tax=Pandoraea pnomenusa TaxID=93220 RepID=UPI001CB8F5A3|nr:DUF1983 domain-containing protein [Pandoraea pnomenusa]